MLILIVYQEIFKKMKKSFFSILALTLAAIIITSCYSSRKSGCPANPQANYRFRG
jgi:hypothetical protein